MASKALSSPGILLLSTYTLKRAVESIKTSEAFPPLKKVMVGDRINTPHQILSCLLTSPTHNLHPYTPKAGTLLCSFLVKYLSHG